MILGLLVLLGLGNANQKLAQIEARQAAALKRLTPEEENLLARRAAYMAPEYLPAPSLPDVKEGCQDEELLQRCIEVFQQEQTASASLLQRRLRLGYVTATRVMNELERRGIVTS